MHRHAAMAVLVAGILGAGRPASAQPADEMALQIKALEAEVAALKRINTGMQARLATLETHMLAQGQWLQLRDRRLEISGDRYTQDIVLRPSTSPALVAGVPGGVQIGKDETVIRMKRIVLTAEDIVLSGRRAIRLDAPDISITGQRPPVVKSLGDIVVKGSQIRDN